MKFAILFVLLSISPTTLLALELKHDQLIGRWLVMEIDGQDAKAENEVWEFNKNTIFIKVNAVSEAEETYTLLGDTIYSGYIRIKVQNISPQEMSIEFDNSRLRLEKLN